MKYLFVLLLILFSCSSTPSLQENPYYLNYTYKNSPQEQGLDFSYARDNIGASTKISAIPILDSLNNPIDTTYTTLTLSGGVFTNSEVEGRIVLGYKFDSAITDINTIYDQYQLNIPYPAVITGYPTNEFHLGLSMNTASTYNPSSEESATFTILEKSPIFTDSQGSTCFDIIFSFESTYDALDPLDKHIYTNGSAKLKVCN